MILDTYEPLFTWLMSVVIWNVIYNARSNRSHPPTSPNTAPATQNASHDWFTSHMKRHLECAEKAKVNLEPHQILRLPRKMNLMIDPRLTWNVIYNARSNRNHNPTSPNTAPATQNESHDWSASHMKRHLQCAEQQESQSNFTKYCACQAKWISWLIRITYETSFTMRGASKVTLQPHQKLRLPRKMNLVIDPRHIWNVIYNARSNKLHTTTSPNTAPATQMNLMIDPRHIWNVIYNARSKHSQPPTSPNTAPATKSVSSRFQWKLRELLPPIERRFEDNPSMIRAWNRHLAPAASETFLVPPWRRILYGKIQHFALRLSIKISPSAAPATKTNTPTSPNTAPATKYAPYSSQCIYSLLLCSLRISSPHLYFLRIYSLRLYSPRIYSLRIYSLSASILSWQLFSSHLFSEHLFSLGIYSLLASFLSWHLFSLGIYSLLASILSRHLFSLGIYSLLASILSRHLFSLGIYSLLASILSRHLFSLGIYSL